MTYAGGMWPGAHLTNQVEAILREHGGSDVDHDQGYLSAIWYTRCLAAHRVVTIVFGPGPEVFEVDLSYRLSMVGTSAALTDLAEVLTRASAAARAIEALQPPRPA